MCLSKTITEGISEQRMHWILTGNYEEHYGWNDGGHKGQTSKLAERGGNRI